jgi:hypothetical protein
MPSPRFAPARSDRAWLLAAVGLYFALSAWVISTRTYWPRYDSGVYISAATAMARGVGLRDITSPVTRPAESWAHVPVWFRRSAEKMDRPDWPFYAQYPPLFSLALAPLVTLGGGRFTVLQLAPFLAGLATLALAYRWRETLFPGPWPLVLFVSAGSMLTLYGTRVQTETTHAVFVLATLRALARAGEDSVRLARWAAVAGVVLLFGISVHVRLVFFAAGAAVWLLVGPRAPLRRRLWVACAFAVLTIAPPVVFTFAASWAGRAGLPLAEAPWTLGRNPYYWSEGWDPSAPYLDRATAAGVVGQRAAATGRLLWNGLSAVGATARPQADLVSLVVLAAAALLAWPAWRHRRGLLALPTLAYIAAVVLSPWTEGRMSVPVLTIVAYGLAIALARLPPVLGVAGPRASRQALVAAGAVTFFAQLGNWWRLTPQLDDYALEYGRRGPTLAIAAVAAAVPPDRVVIAPVDNAAFAIVTGRATMSPDPMEWKMSDPRVFLASGGAPVMLGHLTSIAHLGPSSALGGPLAKLAGPRTRQIVDFGGGYGLLAEWVNAPPLTGSTSPEPLVPGRIHPRWLRLTPADREALARAAIPSPP